MSHISKGTWIAGHITRGTRITGYISKFLHELLETQRRHKSMDQKGPEQLDSGGAQPRTRCALFAIPCAVYYHGGDGGEGSRFPAGAQLHWCRLRAVLPRPTASSPFDSPVRRPPQAAGFKNVTASCLGDT